VRTVVLLANWFVQAPFPPVFDMSPKLLAEKITDKLTRMDVKILNNRSWSCRRSFWNETVVRSERKCSTLISKALNWNLWPSIGNVFREVDCAGILYRGQLCKSERHCINNEKEEQDKWKTERREDLKRERKKMKKAQRTWTSIYSKQTPHYTTIAHTYILAKRKQKNKV